MFSFFPSHGGTGAAVGDANTTALKGKKKKADHRNYIALALSQNKKQQQPDTTQNSESSSSPVELHRGGQRMDPLVDDVIHTYTSRGTTNARTKVLFPAAGEALRNPNNSFVSARTFEEGGDDDDDHDNASSSYHSGFSSAASEEDDDASFVSAAQSAAASIRSRLSLFRRKGKKKNKKKKQQAAKTTTPVASPQKKAMQPAETFDDKSVGGDQSVYSQSSSVFGFSVGSMSVRKILARRKKNKKSKLLSSERSLPGEVGGGRPRSILKRNAPKENREFSVDDEICDISLGATSRQERRKLSDLLSLSSGVRDKRREAAVVSPTPSNTKSTDSLDSDDEDSEDEEDEEGNLLDTRGAYPTDVLQLDRSVIEALEKTGSVSNLDVPDFEPRLEDPLVPLVDASGKPITTKKSPPKSKRATQPQQPAAVQIMDMEFFLKDVEEANRDSEFLEEDDDISSLSLSSCSSLSVSSNPIGQDDYGVYEKKAVKSSSSSYCSPEKLGKHARMTTILHGDIAGPAAAKARHMGSGSFGAYEMPASMQIRTTKTVSLLLLDPVLKIFEIVQVVCSVKTTLAEVFAKAKAAAVDETLAAQTYSGLCNDSREAVNPNALVLRLAPRTELKGFSSYTMTDKEMKQEMERHLLVAVPKTSTAVECQKIRRMLWKNPKLQAWWKATIQLRQHQIQLAASSES